MYREEIHVLPKRKNKIDVIMTSREQHYDVQV